MDSAEGLSTRIRMLAAEEGLLMGSLLRNKSEMAVTAAVSWLIMLPSIRRPSLRGDLEEEDAAPPLLPDEVDEDEASARVERW